MSFVSDTNVFRVLRTHGSHFTAGPFVERAVLPGPRCVLHTRLMPAFWPSAVLGSREAAGSPGRPSGGGGELPAAGSRGAHHGLRGWLPSPVGRAHPHSHCGRGNARKGAGEAPPVSLREPSSPAALNDFPATPGAREASWCKRHPRAPRGPAGHRPGLRRAGEPAGVGRWTRPLRGPGRSGPPLPGCRGSPPRPHCETPLGEAPWGLISR